MSEASDWSWSDSLEESESLLSSELLLLPLRSPAVPLVLDLGEA